MKPNVINIHIGKKIFFIIAFACFLKGFTQKQKQKRPNFIVILTDDQSWVGTSFLADPKDNRSKSDFYETPNMERLASMGMRLTNGYAPAPFCSPTRKSILTGLTPAKHEYQKDRENWTKVFRKEMTIPKILKLADENYATAHFGKWDARYDQFTPEEMGYDFSDGLTGNNTGGGKKIIEIGDQEIPFTMGKEWPASYDDPKLIFDLTTRSNDFIEEQTKNNKPFFIQISHYAVHLAITHSEKSIDKYNNLKKGEKHFVPEFAAMTEDMDEGIGMILDKVEALGILENTYIVFLSDNGGRSSIPIGKKQITPRNFPLRGGKGSMYEGGIRVPFVVVGPGVNKGSFSDVPITGLDLLPTLADLSGFNGVLPDKIDGGSIKEILHNNGNGKVKRNSPYLIFHQAANRKPKSAIRSGNFKLVKHWDEKMYELFDLSKDIEEKNDLSKELPEMVQELDKELISFLYDANAEIIQNSKK